MDDEGRTFVFDRSNKRLTEYDSSGEYVTSFQVPDFGCCAWNMHPRSYGFLWVPLREVDPETLQVRYGAQLVRAADEGLTGDPIWVPEIDFDGPTYEVAGRRIPTPFSPRVVTRPTPGGQVLAGASDRYRFEILRADGSKTVVERFWQPTPIDLREREWHRRLTVADWRSSIDGWTWNGSEMPQHRPAFISLIGTVHGGIWVGRDIGAERVSDCMADPLEDYAGETVPQQCFQPVRTIDAFDAEGRYLGNVETPSELRPFGMYINQDLVVGYAEDKDGIVRVKRYRLVLPGER